MYRFCTIVKQNACELCIITEDQAFTSGRSCKDFISSSAPPNWRSLDLSSMGNSPAPLVRNAPQILYGNAFPNLKKRGGSSQEFDEVRIYQGASDFFLGPEEPFEMQVNQDLDFEPELAVIIDFVPVGASPEIAEKQIKILTACNDFTYRTLAASDIKRGFGFVQSKPLSSFAKFGISPKLYPEIWNNGKPKLGLETSINGNLHGRLSTADMLFSFPTLISFCAKTRSLPPGTILTSGTVSMHVRNQKNHGCIIEQLAYDPNQKTAYIQPGDVISIKFSTDLYPQYSWSKSVFGNLTNKVVNRL